MAPEVIASGDVSSKHYDHKADSWSLGVMLYHMYRYLL